MQSKNLHLSPVRHPCPDIYLKTSRTHALQIHLYGDFSEFRGYTECESLPGSASFYTAEINPLLIGLGMSNSSNKKPFLGFFDSLSCMQALGNGNTSKPLLTQVLEEHTAL